MSQLQQFRFRKRLVTRLRTGECEAAQGFGWGVRDTYITFVRTSAAERRPFLARYEFEGRLYLSKQMAV